MAEEVTMKIKAYRKSNGGALGNAKEVWQKI